MHSVSERRPALRRAEFRTAALGFKLPSHSTGRDGARCKRYPCCCANSEISAKDFSQPELLLLSNVDHKNCDPSGNCPNLVLTSSTECKSYCATWKFTVSPAVQHVSLRGSSTTLAARAQPATRHMDPRPVPRSAELFSRRRANPGRQLKRGPSLGRVPAELNSDSLWRR